MYELELDEGYPEPNYRFKKVDWDKSPLNVKNYKFNFKEWQKRKVE